MYFNGKSHGFVQFVVQQLMFHRYNEDPVTSTKIM